MEKLQTTLKSLRLGAMGKALPLRYQEAKANELDYLEFLERLVDDELAKRKENVLNRRIKLAKFPGLKTLDEFDFTFNPTIQKKTLNELAACRFIYNAQNVLFVGPPGVGKSHMAIALGLAAIQNGYTVLYKNAFDLVEEMADAHREGHRKKMVAQYVAYSLLILDEFGMKKMPPNAADDLLEIIHRRHNETSMIIATNRPIEDWGTILGDNAATSAILDRFLEDASILTIKGKSYRMNKKKEQ